MGTITEKFKERLGKFDVDPQTIHHFSDSLYARQMVIPKGFEALGHAHTFDHLSILASGEVILKTDDGEQHFKAPACINIVKHKHHSITALEDAVWFCIHATDEKTVEDVEKISIMKEEV